MKDFTKGDLRCPHCQGPFAREAMIHGKPAHKIIQGKVFYSFLCNDCEYVVYCRECQGNYFFK